MADEAKQLELKITTTADLAAVKQADDAIAGLTDTAKKSTAEFQFLGKSGEHIRKIGEEGEYAAGGLRSAKESAHGLHQVLDGLSHGGVGGLTTAARGAINVIHSLGATLRTIGPIGGAAFGVVGSAVLVLNLEAKKLQEQMKRIFDERGKQSEQLVKTLEAEKAAAEKNLEAQRAAVEKLKNEYAELIQTIATGTAQTQALNALRTDLKRSQLDREEQRALGQLERERPGAQATPQELEEFEQRRSRVTDSIARRRQGIEDSAAADKLGDLAIGGRQQIDLADEQSRKIQTKRDDLTRTAKDARTAADVAKAEASTLARREGVDAPGTRAAQKEALELARAADTAEKALKEFTEAVLEQLRQLTAQRSEGQNKIDQAKLGGEILQNKAEADALKAGTDANPRLRELAEQSRAALERGDFAAQDKFNAEIRKIKDAAKQEAARAQSTRRAVTAATSEDRPRPAPAADDGLVIKMDQQTSGIIGASAQLLAAQERNAAAFSGLVGGMKRNYDRGTRQALNAREQ